MGTGPTLSRMSGLFKEPDFDTLQKEKLPGGEQWEVFMDNWFEIQTLAYSRDEGKQQMGLSIGNVQQKYADKK